VTDYWLSKMFYDLQSAEMTQAWRADRSAVMKDYPLRDDMRQAVLNDDIAAIAPHVNAYLLRFYCAICGMTDAEFIDSLQPLAETATASDG
jgi:hypothetical protein